MTPAALAAVERFGVLVGKFNNLAKDEMLKMLPDAASEEDRNEAAADPEFQASAFPMVQSALNFYFVGRLEGLSPEEAEEGAEAALRALLQATGAMAKVVNDKADSEYRAKAISKWGFLLRVEEIRKPDSDRARLLRRVIEDLKTGKPLNEINDVLNQKEPG